MTVYFIGAGPGDPDLITVKGKALIEQCHYCLYAGSLVPQAVIAIAPADAKVMDTAAMTLDDIMAAVVAAHDGGHDVARVHSGDPSLYGAIAEQIRRLKALGIDYKIIPGVSAYAAAAAEMGTELTIPEVAQSLILTRTTMKSSPMPKGEDLDSFGKIGTTLVIHLSVRNLREIERRLTPYYGTDCAVVVAYRVGWPDQEFIHGTLSTIRSKVMAAKITRTALIFIGPALSEVDGFRDSALYDKDHVHVLRTQRGNRDERDKMTAPPIKRRQ
jgi:precorrin-4/cobalt-precorrin-4 C11-methyltransferase